MAYYQYYGAHSITFYKDALDNIYKFGDFEFTKDVEELIVNRPDLKTECIKNSWNDWKLIPTTSPIVSPAPLKTNIINIPGGDGEVDLSMSLTGHYLYSNRKGSWEFYCINETNNGHYWSKICSDISSFFNDNEHPSSIMVVLDDDKGFYYIGSVNLNEIKSDKSTNKIIIDYNFYPYKFSLISSYINGNRVGKDNEEKFNFYVNRNQTTWLWDNLDFEKSFLQYPTYVSYNSTSSSGGTNTGYAGLALVNGESAKIHIGEDFIPFNFQINKRSSQVNNNDETILIIDNELRGEKINVNYEKIKGNVNTGYIDFRYEPSISLRNKDLIFTASIKSSDPSASIGIIISKDGFGNTFHEGYL